VGGLEILDSAALSPRDDQATPGSQPEPVFADRFSLHVPEDRVESPFRWAGFATHEEHSTLYNNLLHDRGSVEIRIWEDPPGLQEFEELR
jgi:hypothetical protein